MYLHLTQLKARILSPEVASQTRFDTRLAAVAAGVAAAFDSYCGRTFIRAEGAMDRHPGGSGFYTVARYPVESVASATLAYSDGSTEAMEIARFSRSAGLVHFLSAQGRETDEVRIVSTGGFWADTSATLDGTLPTGAAALPADLLDAWVLQCDHEARVRRIFGGTSTEDMSEGLPVEFDLLPRVKRVLGQYMRMI